MLIPMHIDEWLGKYNYFVKLRKMMNSTNSCKINDRIMVIKGCFWLLQTR